MGDMRCAGVLLTGGASRRMGVDKATLVVGAQGGQAATLARRTAGTLIEVAEMAVEVGPGRSGLPAFTEDPPGGGPLAGFVEGCSRLRAAGWDGPVLLVATDLPDLDADILRWLAAYPAGVSAVPLLEGIPQPLCARYGPKVVDIAVEVLNRGQRSMGALLDAIEPHYLLPERDGAPSGWRRALTDVDTPEALAGLDGEDRIDRSSGARARHARLA